MVDGIQELISVLQTDAYETSKTYSAEVSSIDSGGTVWVYLAGSIMETPTALSSAEVSVGDYVNVEWRNNKLYIAGNVSNPSAGVVRVTAVEQAAQIANQAAQSAVVDAGIARQAADNATLDAERAKDAADAVSNNLKSVVQGATTVEKAVSVMQTALEAVAEYDPNAITETFTGDGIETDFTLQKKATNILSVTVGGESVEYTSAVVDGVTVVTITPAPDNDASISVSYDTVKEYFWHDANGAHVLGDDNGYRNDITSSGMKIMDVTNEESVAEFGSSGAQIGQSNTAHLKINNSSLTLLDGDEDALVYFGGLVKGDIFTDTFTYSGSSYFYLTSVPKTNSLIVKINDVPTTSYIQNDKSLSITATLTMGDIITAQYQLLLSLNCFSFGSRIGIFGNHSFTQGYENAAEGFCAHAEGSNAQANGYTAHAEGSDSIASGHYSHAQNYKTLAAYGYQTVIGKYNDNQSDTAFEIGNGTSDNARANALTVDWQGRVECGDYSGVFKSIFDIFYPVGSYYETSDTTFDPNVTWGGTWSLETAGQVHVSAGTGYTVVGALTNTSDGGSKDAIIPYHNHTLTNPTVKTPTLTVDNSHAGEYVGSATGISSLNRQLSSAGTSGGDYNYLRVAHDGLSLTRSSPSISAGKTCTVTGGSIGYAGTNGNATNANMQPYIVVNRWHRTA